MPEVSRLFLVTFTDTDGNPHEVVLDEEEAAQLVEFLSNALPPGKKPR